MPHRFIIVSAINDYYLPLLIDLLRSLRDCPAGMSFDIGLFDVGLSEQNRRQISTFGIIVKAPGVDIDYPDRSRWEQSRPYLRAMTSRPFIPAYFPGYEAYMWMDADSWVQTPEALQAMLGGAVDGDRLYICSECDVDYPATREGGALWQEWFDSYRRCLGAEDAALMRFRPMLNVGVFALGALAPHWKVWAQTLAQALGRIPEMKQEHFVMEQLCLNLAVIKNNLGLSLMPAEFNWMTVLGLPVWDEEQRLYVRPSPPHRVLSVVHLAAQIKNTVQSIRTRNGQDLQRALTYDVFKRHREI